MREVICDTSPIQYLHQLGALNILHALARRVWIPPAVSEEISAGLSLGVDLPSIEDLEWIAIRPPRSAPALPLVTDLGPGEAQVLALALESADVVAIIDDALARQVARVLGIKMRGTLGLLLDAKKAGLIGAVAPLLDELHSLRFRVSPSTRADILRLAGETN